MQLNSVKRQEEKEKMLDNTKQIEKRLLTVEELATYMGTTISTIYTLKCKGKIPSNCIVKRGKSLRFDLIEIDKWINELKGEAHA